MLQYVIGPAASAVHCRSVLSETRSQSITPASGSCQTSDQSIAALASSATLQSTSTGSPARPEVVSSVSHRDVTLPTVAVPDQLPVGHVTVARKKRGRKPKKRRRGIKGPAPSSSSGSGAGGGGQPSLDYCNSVSAEQQQRPAPKKRGRKPKPRPEVPVAVVDDVTAGAESAPTGERPASTAAGNAIANAVGTGNAIASDAAAAVVVAARRRGRKRKDRSSEPADGPRAKNTHVDDERGQSVWKVTSPAASQCGSGEATVVPRIKVTNIRASTDSSATPPQRASTGETNNNNNNIYSTFICFIIAMYVHHLGLYCILFRRFLIFRINISLQLTKL